MASHRKKTRVSIFDALLGFPIHVPAKKRAPEKTAETPPANSVPSYPPTADAADNPEVETTPAVDAPSSSSATEPAPQAAPEATPEATPEAVGAAAASANPPSTDEPSLDAQAESKADPEKSATDVDGFTQAQRNLLMQLKDTEGKTWKEIHIRMEKFSQKILKNKYKEIKYPRPGQSAEEAKPEDGLKERKKAKDVSRREGKTDERAGAPGPETIAEVVSDVPVINVDPGDDFPLRATMEDMAHTKAREGDDGWRASELALLAEIAARNEKYKWLQIASQFYDRTGIRISAAAVKAKLDGGTL